MATITTSFSLDKQTIGTIKAIAKLRGKSQSDVIRDVMRRQQFLLELDTIRTKAQPFFKKAGVATEDDVYNKLGL